MCMCTWSTALVSHEADLKERVKPHPDNWDLCSMARLLRRAGKRLHTSLLWVLAQRGLRWTLLTTKMPRRSA